LQPSTRLDFKIHQSFRDIRNLLQGVRNPDGIGQRPTDPAHFVIVSRANFGTKWPGMKLQSCAEMLSLPLIDRSLDHMMTACSAQTANPVGRL